MTTPLTPHQQISEKILSLQAALLEQHPRMPSLLQEIHRNLKNDPAVVTLLSEEEIAILVSGLQRQTQVTIVAAQAKPSAAAKKALKNVTADELF